MTNEEKDNLTYYYAIFIVGGCSSNREVPNDFVTPCPGVGCEPF